MPGDDPFEGLILDEDFIRGAQHREPAHADRRRQAPPPKRRKPWGFVIGGVGIVTVAAVALVSHGSSPKAAPTTTPSPSARASAAPASKRPTPSPHASPSAEIGLVDQHYISGACYTWDQRPAVTTADVVSCSGKHLFQAIGAITITGQRTGTPYPTDAQWQALGRDQCSAGAAALLKAPVDPNGIFFADLIHPEEHAWADGDRHAVCGFGHVGTVPGRPNDLVAFTGDVRTTPQHPLPPILKVGTCQVEPKGKVASTVPCSQAHTLEVVGSFIPDGNPVKQPSDAELGKEAATRCVALADSYLGHPLSDLNGAGYSYSEPGPGDWAAGGHTITCSISTASHQGTLRKP